MKRSIFCLIFLSAFFASAIKAQTIFATPSSGHQFQTFEITIRGDSTNFKSINAGITFIMDGIDSFSAEPNANPSASKITAYVSIPGDAPAGTYDVRVINSLTDSIYYSAPAAFTVNPGVPPSISILPDSGAAGTNFTVTINGSNTFFNAAEYSSELNEIAVDLTSPDSVSYSANPSSITNDSEMKSLFVLPDTLQEGLYIARVHTLGLQPSFDISQYFRVKPVPVITLPNTNSGQAGRTVSVDVLVQGSPIPGPNMQVFLAPTGNHANMFPADTSNQTSDSTFTSIFTLKSTLTIGSYDIIILAFNDLSITGKSVFTVVPFSSVDIPMEYTASLEVSPNPAHGNVDFSFSLPNPVHAKLIIFDALGRNIGTLFDATINGQQSIDWNSDKVLNGSYFYELSAGEYIQRGRIIVRR